MWRGLLSDDRLPHVQMVKFLCNVGRPMMRNNFNVKIDCLQSLKEEAIDRRVYRYDPELDNLTSVVWDLSDALYARGVVFELAVGGRDYIVLGAELSIFLEQFEALLNFTLNPHVDSCTLDFFEQGARYLFSFEKKDRDCYEVTGMNKDAPDGVAATTTGSLLDLQLVLVTFYWRVDFLTRKLCPSIAEGEIYLEWQRSIEFLRKTFIVDERY